MLHHSDNVLSAVTWLPVTWSPAALKLLLFLLLLHLALLLQLGQHPQIFQMLHNRHSWIVLHKQYLKPLQAQPSDAAGIGHAGGNLAGRYNN
jgi:hypothetical protein